MLTGKVVQTPFQHCPRRTEHNSLSIYDMKESRSDDGGGVNDASCRSLLVSILKLAIPLSVQWLVAMGQWLVPMFYLGHVSTAALGGYALGNMFCNCTGNALVQGFLSNLGTLLSQAYGAKQAEKFALYTQRNIVICTIASIVIGVVWWTVPALILPFLGVQDDVRVVAVRFSRLMCWQIFPNFMFEIQKRYLASQDIVVFPALIYIPMVLLNIFICSRYIPIIGTDAACYGLIWSTIMGALILLLYILGMKTNVMKHFSLYVRRNPFVGWREIFKLGIPGALMLMLDWGSFEINSIFAGKLGDSPLAAHSLLVQTVSIAYMIPLGCAYSTSIVVGQRLGEEKTGLAKKAAHVGILLCFMMELLILGLLFVFRRSYFTAFISSKHTVDVASSTMVFAVGFGLLDSLQCGITNVLNGIGKQDVTWKYMLGYPFIGLPAGYLYCFNLGLGLMGVWLGMVTSLVVVDSSLLVLFCGIDWEHEQSIVNKRTRDNASEALLSVQSSPRRAEDMVHAPLDCADTDAIQSGASYQRIPV